MGEDRPDETSGIINELEPGEETAEEGPAKAGRGGARSKEDGPRHDDPPAECAD